MVGHNRNRHWRRVCWALFFTGVLLVLFFYLFDVQFNYSNQFALKGISSRFLNIQNNNALTNDYPDNEEADLHTIQFGTTHILKTTLLSKIMNPMSTTYAPTEATAQQMRYDIRFKNLQMNCTMQFAQPCALSTELLILTASRRNGFANRNAIRETWLKDALPGQEIRFLVADGPKKEDIKIGADLQKEQAQFGDLVLVNGFEDTYKNLYLKLFSGFQWQQVHCAKAVWVLKADDDSVVHLQRLDHFIRQKFERERAAHPALFVGHLLFGGLPIRDKTTKWYLSEAEYPAARFPTYCSGPVYLGTSRAIAAILARGADVNAIFLEDVLFTGILSELANVTRLDHKEHFQWGTGFNSAKCENGTHPAVSLWGADGLKGFRHHYKRLRDTKC